MGQRERFIVFLMGAMLGVGILLAGRSCNTGKQEQLRQVRAALHLPPMMYDYAVMHKGFYGHYVLYEKVTKTPTAQVREIVTGGSRRYDANGRELPEEYLWITETYDLGTPLAEVGPVKAYTFAYADRGLVTLKSGHSVGEVALLKGEQLTAIKDKPLQYSFSLVSPKSDTPWAKIPQRWEELSHHAAVERVEWVKIDWETEAELIRANTGKAK